MTPADRIRELAAMYAAPPTGMISSVDIVRELHAILDHLESEPSNGLREAFVAGADYIVDIDDELLGRDATMHEAQKEADRRYFATPKPPESATNEDIALLVEAVGHLLIDHDCDHDKYEEWQAAMSRCQVASAEPPESADRPEPTFDKWPDGQFTTVMERQAFSMGWDARGAEPGSEWVKK